MCQQAGEQRAHGNTERSSSHQASAEQLQLQPGALPSSSKEAPEHKRAPQHLSQQPSSDLQQASSNASERLSEHQLKGYLGRGA